MGRFRGRRGCTGFDGDEGTSLCQRFGDKEQPVAPRHCDALHLLGQTFFIPPATTTTPGIFAVGDVRAGSVKRVASSVGVGSVVISKVWQYLNG